jgi:hypothetical protein
VSERAAQVRGVRVRGRISRDTVLLVAGLAGIGWQQYTERVVWPLLVVYAVMIGLPGRAGAAGVAARPGGGAGRGRAYYWVVLALSLALLTALIASAIAKAV